MAYATAAQVASEAKISNGFHDAPVAPSTIPATNPTATKVGEIIAEVEAMIDARISRKYRIPLTVSGNQVLMRGISLALCVERVREIMEVKTGAANVEQQQWKTTADVARKNLERIVLGEIPLAGEALAAAAGDGVRSYAKDSGQTPFFKKGCEQW